MSNRPVPSASADQSHQTGQKLGHPADFKPASDQKISLKQWLDSLDQFRPTKVYTFTDHVKPEY